MNIKKANKLPREVVTAGTKTYRQILISPDEAPNFAMRRFIIESGGGMPRHTNTVEHEQYVLSGLAIIGIGDEVFEVEKGDVVFIPAGIPHWYKVEANEPFEFLCMVPNKPDKTIILDES
jgi:quercetin dioxygenase-like cupin family protein